MLEEFMCHVKRQHLSISTALTIPRQIIYELVEYFVPLRSLIKMHGLVGIEAVAKNQKVKNQKKGTMQRTYSDDYPKKKQLSKTSPNQLDVK